MADQIIKFRDALGAADSYLHALRMMFESREGEPGGKDYCSFLLIVEAAQKEVSTAHGLVDEMEGE